MEIIANGNLAAVLAIAALAGSVLILLLGILYYAGFWGTLQKMGRHDFAALVPFYGSWELARGAGLGPGASTIFVLLAVGQVACSVLVLFNVDYSMFAYGFNFTAQVPIQFVLENLSANVQDYMRELYSQNAVAILVWAVLAAVSFLMYLVVLFGVARSFGHGIGYMLGLLIFPFLFFMVLGYARKQVYTGPYLDKDQRFRPRLPWETLVRARMATFGSNAPLALALMGMVMGVFLLTVPAIVLCIVALAKNGAEKGKPLTAAKRTMTTVVAVLGILLSLAALALFLFLGYAANGHYY